VQSLQVDGWSDHDNRSNPKKGEHPVAYRISVAVLTFVRLAGYGLGGLVMAFNSCRGVLACCLFILFLVTHRGEAQTIDGSAPDGKATTAQHLHMDMPMETGWQFMRDGIVFLNFNHQGGPRGGNELVVPNWWMGMASRDSSHGRLTFTSMLNLEPATVGNDGYRELFQVGEALHGRPLIDRQHPHDLFMQLAAVWRIALNDSTGFTLVGAPVGEPALGPVAFMHRPSAADNPTAPLGHHTFDSTHVSFGVVTAAVDHGRWFAEGSIFNGREPDEHRWDFDFGRLDSVSGRLWFRPAPEWELQVSSGHLTEPEELEPGNITRSTVSAAWLRGHGNDFSAATVGYGVNSTDHGSRNAVFVEGARHSGLNGIYGRFEAVQVETALLQTDAVVKGPTANVTNPVFAFTAGAVRDVLNGRGWEGGVGADVTFYRTPDALRSAYGDHPVSFHVFFRLRPPAGSMGRMWNMRMSQPMVGHTEMPMNHPMP
jgi:hypothetical protein